MQIIREELSPSLLKEIHGPPKKLLVIGNFPPESPCVAIVGTRNPSPYGREMAKWFASTLAKQGYTIVSGLARGIDSIAHQGTVSVSGKTIAVLGFGLQIPICSEENILRKKIVECGGAIISEFPNDFRANKATFPQRNRIISGLSIATLIIEAPEKSGALITANFALEQGREVFAIPGNIGQKNSVGCNNLIKKGEAQLVTSPEEIIAIISEQPLPFSLAHPKPEEKLPADEKLVFEILARGAAYFDDLLRETHFSVPHVQGILTQLELKDLIYRTPYGFLVKPGSQ